MLQSNQTITGTTASDYVKLTSAQNNAGNVALGAGDDLVYITGWGSVMDRSIDGQGGINDTIVIEASVLQQIQYFGSGSGKITFTTGGTLLFNNVENVVTTNNSEVIHSQDIVINAELVDQDGSETLSAVSISVMPSGVEISQDGASPFTTDGNIFSVSVTSGVDSTLSMTYEGSLNSTITGTVFATETSTGDIATVSATQVIDSFIEGLEYVTSSGITGVTNDSGFLNYTDGDVITLSVGNITLGTIDSGEEGIQGIFMHDIAGVEASDLDNPYVQNLAVFLQSIDEDSNPENGITISEVTHYLFEEVDLDLSTASLAMVNQVLTEQGFEPVPVEQAMAHVEAALADAGEIELVDTVERVYDIDIESLIADMSESGCDNVTFDNLPDNAVMSHGEPTEAGWVVTLEELESTESLQVSIEGDELSDNGLNYTMSSQSVSDAALTHTTIQDCGMMIDEAANTMCLNDISMEVAVNIDDAQIGHDVDDLNNLV